MSVDPEPRSTCADSAQFVRVGPPDTPSECAIGQRADILQTILEPDVQLAIWTRGASSQIRDEVEQAGLDALRDLRVPLQGQPSEQDLSALVAAAGADIDRCRAWVADMAQLLGYFFGLLAPLKTPHSVRLRIESPADDACRRFHVDRSRLRLLCTYRGPGTEWLAEDQVDRHALATHQPNERILRFGEPRRLEPFWVAVMKGDHLPGNAGRGLVHRSPPIAGTGRRRLLFCLDA